ncbi:ATPase family AAA domain-containing protein 5-like [Oculina patagonica]
MAVNSFMQNAKCPIVLISTESQVSSEGRCDQINLKPPSVNLLAAHLQLVALTNNLFVNPEDLKSLVAQNNCDIRKSLLNLQFWSESGGGIKIPYKRPASLKDKAEVVDNHPKLQRVSVSYDSNSEHAKSNDTPSQDVLQIEPPVTSGILNDDGEESMFLSLSDWQVIKNKGARRSSRTSQRGSLRQVEVDNNSDSDFCEPKKKTLVCNDGSTDSIFEITDTNDSQPVSGADKKADDSLQLPLMDSLLFESSHGLLNCVADHTIGSLSVFQKEKKPGDIVEDCDLSDKLHMMHFSQGQDLNLIHTNLSNLIPLFADSSTSSPQTKLDPLLIEGCNTAQPITEHVEIKGNSIFSDKSLFDDGTEESVDKVENDVVMKTYQTVEKGLEDTKARAMHSSQDSTDTGFSESQPKEEIGEEGKGQGEGHKEGTKDSVEKGRKFGRKKPSNEEKCCSKALEIFARFAENMSFSDALCPSLSVSNTQSTSAETGWWGASLKPGLTDDHVTVQECSDWLARDTRASLRGALEVANLESCRVRINSLAEDLKEIENSTQDENSAVESGLFNFKLLSEDLPPRDSSNVVRLDELTQIQKRSTESRRKLYSSLGSCIPALYHCDHRCVASDYIPTLRLLCHSERLREAANIKRRFLHYLNFNSFPVSRSTMEALADSYLTQ